MNRERFIAQESEWLSQVAGEMGWELHYDQLERGRFASVAEYAGTGDAQFFREHYNRALCIHGAAPAGMAAFLLPAHRPGTASFCGEAITRETLCAYTRGDEGAICTPAGYDYINFAFAAERFDRALRVLHHRTLAEILPHTAALSAPTASVARLQTAAQTAFASPAPEEVLDLAVADRATEERVLAALCAALTAGDPPRPGLLAARNHWRCVRTVRGYAEAHLGESLGLETLCSVAGVSERTLNTAFREVVGVSPQQFIKARRLNAARHALAAARRSETPVKSVALHLGFWHLGYFARDYKAHLGESPSETLAR